MVMCVSGIASHPTGAAARASTAAMYAPRGLLLIYTFIRVSVARPCVRRLHEYYYFGFGLVWFALVWFGSVWFGSVRFGSVRFGSVRFGSVRFGSVRFGSVVRFGLVLIGAVLFWLVWFGWFRSVLLCFVL